MSIKGHMLLSKLVRFEPSDSHVNEEEEDLRVSFALEF